MARHNIKGLILSTIIFSGCGKEENKIYVPEQEPQPVLVEVAVPQTEANFSVPVPGVTLINEDQEISDPPDMDHIEIGSMKCQSQVSQGIGGKVCVYGLDVKDKDGNEHKKYFSCLLIGRELTNCNPIELFTKK